MAGKSILEIRAPRFLLGTLGAGLIVSSALIAPALAQNGPALKAEKGWAVQKLKDAKGGDYCALSRPYTDSSVLTLAKNGKSEYSLAVDLQSPKLDSEKPYSVTMQFGPGQLRAYEVMPSSPSAFVVRLGSNESFLDALTESQVLKVQIGEDRYEYEVAEFPSGLNDLESCMAGGVKVPEPQNNQLKEAKASEVKSKHPQKLSRASSLLSAEPTNAAAGFQAKKMTAAPAMPAPEVSVVEAPKKEMAVTIAKAKTPAKPEAKPASATKSKVVAKQPEPVKAESVLEIVDHKQGDVVIKTSKTAPELPLTPVPEPEVKAEIKAAPKPEPVKEAVKAKAETTRMSTFDARASMEFKQLEQEVQQLRARNQQLSGDLAKAMTEQDTRASKSIMESKAQIVDLQAKLEAAKADSQNLLRDNERLKRLNEDGMLGNAKGDWDLEQATKRFNESEREIQRLALELDREKASCQRRTAEIEGMLFDPAVADQEQRTRLVALEQELEALRKIQGVQQEEVDRRIAAAIQEQSAKASAEKAELNAQITSLQTNLAKAQADMAKKPDVDPAMLAEKSALEQQVDKLTKELAGTKADLMAAKTEPKVDPAMAQEVQKLRAELAEAKSAPKGAQIAVAEKEALEQRVATLNGQIKAMEFDLQQAREQAGSGQQQVAALKNMQEQMAELQKQRDTANDQVVLLKTELEKARLKFAQKQGDIATRADQTASLRLENERLRTQLSMKDKESTTFRNQVAGLQQDLAQMKSRLNLAEVQPTQNTGEVQALRHEINSMRSQMSRMQTENQKVVASLQNDRRNLEGELARKAVPASLQPVNRSVEREPLNASVQAPSPSAPLAPAVNGFSQGSLQTLLSSAGLDVRQVNRSGANSYNWNAGQLSGKAMTRSGGSMDSNIQGYIAQERANCQGDFASMPSSEGRSRSSYEIACVSPAASKSASVVFFERDGSFVAIAHEASTNDMDLAMDARDRIVSQLSGTQSAAW